MNELDSIQTAPTTRAQAIAEGWQLAGTQHGEGGGEDFAHPITSELVFFPFPTIAKNLREFQAALFKGPRTFDGYIRRVVKGGIRLFILGENYTLNDDGVFCYETKQANGKTWYSYGGELNKRTMRERADLADIIRDLLK